MRIAQVSTLATPVQETGADSVEGLVWLLTRELVRRGHHVTVFAAAGSVTDGELVATLPGSYGRNDSMDDWQLGEWINLVRAVGRSRDFDVIHTHAYLWGIPLEPLSAAPMLHTMHVMPDADSARLRRMSPTSVVSGLSQYQWSHFPDLPPHAIVSHGIDPAHFVFQERPGDHVCFLGRFIPGKGPLAAIASARELGLRLLLAGPRNAYYDEVIAPLVDGRAVEYVGAVAGEERSRFLGGARALLYPLESPEPFGLVPIEAMMCGTPVAAMRIGAVPEVVEEGVTGSCAERAEAFVEHVERALDLDRAGVRRRAEERFAYSRMVDGYSRLYEEVASGLHASRRPRAAGTGIQRPGA